jgi:hypothetical protein
VFGGYVHGGWEEGDLASDAGDMDYDSGLFVREEMRDGELGQTDWVGDVDV